MDTANLGRNTLGNIYRAQAPAFAALTGIDATTVAITKQLQESVEYHSESRLRLKSCTESLYTPQSAHSTTEAMLVSGVVMSYACYYLSLGQISLSFGWGSRKQVQNVTDEEFSLVGRWDFNPASWVSYRSIGIQARLLARFGELSKPRITPSLTARVCVSESHPVWGCIRNGDVMGIQRHLSTKSIGINDTTLKGSTLLREVGTRLVFPAKFYQPSLSYERYDFTNPGAGHRLVGN